MNTRSNKLVLLLIAITLVVSPLRGAIALADAAPSGTEAESHCAQMQAANAHPPELHMAQPGQDKVDPASHDCEQGCGGSCCDGTCNACVHAVTTALNGSPAFQPIIPGAVLNSISSDFFPERSLPPPLHPPATLRS